MTDQETEILICIYALGDRIREKRWDEALAAWEWLLNTYAPMQQLQPHLREVLQDKVTLLQLAERHASKHRH